MPKPALELNKDEQNLAMEIRSLKDQINGLLDILNQKRQHLNELPAELNQKISAKLQVVETLRTKIVQPINTKEEIKKAEHEVLENMTKAGEHALAFISSGESHKLTLANHSLETANAILIKIITFDKLPKKEFRPKVAKAKTAKENAEKVKVKSKSKHKDSDQKTN